MSWRKIKVHDRDYTWKYKGGTVTVQSPDRKKHSIFAGDLVEMRTVKVRKVEESNGFIAITPKDVRTFILRELWSLQKEEA